MQDNRLETFLKNKTQALIQKANSARSIQLSETTLMIRSLTYAQLDLISKENAAVMTDFKHMTKDIALYFLRIREISDNGSQYIHSNLVFSAEPLFLNVVNALSDDDEIMTVPPPIPPTPPLMDVLMKISAAIEKEQALRNQIHSNILSTTAMFKIPWRRDWTL